MISSETPRIRNSSRRNCRRHRPSRHIAGNPFWTSTTNQITVSCYYVGADKMHLPYRIKAINPEA